MYQELTCIKNRVSPTPSTSGSQWRNGACEIFVKKVKKTLTHLYGNKLFNFQELNTALKRVANAINSRPIYAKGGPTGGADPEYLTTLTPNMLLMARANNKLPQKD